MRFDPINGAMISPPCHVVPFVKAIRDGEFSAMLDLGCGIGFFGMLFRMQSVVGAASWIAGCDMYIEHMRFRDWYDVIFPGNIDERLHEMQMSVPGDRVPVIVLLEVIEHLTVEAGTMLLQQVAKSGLPLLISSPFTPYTLGKNEDGLEHVSLWHPQDVKGYFLKERSLVFWTDEIYDTDHWMGWYE